MIGFKQLKTPLLRTLTITTTAFLFACGGGGGSSDDGGGSSSSGGGSTSAADIQEAAKSSISGNINNSLGSLGDIATNSDALAKLAEAFGVDTSGVPKGVNSAEGDDDVTGVLEQDIEDFLTALLVAGTATMTGDNQVTVEYTTDQATALCSTNLSNTVDSDEAECIDFFTNLKIVINSTGTDAGNLTIAYSGFALVTIDYAPNSVAYTWDLDPLTSAIELLSANAMSITEKLRYVYKTGGVVARPETVEGVLKLSIQDTVTQSIKFENTTSINIVDTDYNFSLAPSTLWELGYDSQLNTAFFAFDYGDLSATGPVEDDFGNPYSCMVHSEVTRWRWDLTDDGNLLTGEGTFGGANSAYMDLTPLGGATAFRELEAHLMPTKISIDNTGLINHDMQVNAFMQYDNNFNVFDSVFGDAAYFFSKFIALDSEFQLGRDETDQLAFLVNSGSFSASGSSGSLSASSGDCVAIEDHTAMLQGGGTLGSASFPYALTTCDF